MIDRYWLHAFAGPYYGPYRSVEAALKDAFRLDLVIRSSGPHVGPYDDVVCQGICVTVRK